MLPPFLSFTTFNRLGLTSRNIRSLLDTPEDFEMHIVDCNSADNTWEFIQDLNDSRIKSKTRLPVNVGPIYASNFNLARRKEDQYFITVDSDVYINTKNWIKRFMEVFDAFPEAGLLGVMRGKPYSPIYPEVIKKSKNMISYLELKNAHIDEFMGFIHGCCQCLRPELIKETGYWSEENGWGDAELSIRVNNYTRFKAGYVSDMNFNNMINIDMTQSIPCEKCTAKAYCKLDRTENTCFSLRNKYYCNEAFVDRFKWKYYATFKELAEGKRTAYCASIFDPLSMKTYLYNMDWAFENMTFYIVNSN